MAGHKESPLDVLKYKGKGVIYPFLNIYFTIQILYYETMGKVLTLLDVKAILLAMLKLITFKVALGI